MKNERSSSLPVCVDHQYDTGFILKFSSQARIVFRLIKTLQPFKQLRASVRQ
jgi:hypothetical protein